jgi:putative NADPH-quinone reductase
MNKKIFILLGHPDDESYCGALFRSYEAGAREGGHEVRIQSLQRMDFNANLEYGYNAIQELEPDLRMFQENIRWAEHIVIVFPIWWGTFPSRLKGVFDRAILPGFGFKYYKKNGIFWRRLLKGKSARLIITMGMPRIAYLLTSLYVIPGVRLLKYGILKFCGISPVYTSSISRVLAASPEKRERFLAKIKKLGIKGK